MNRMFAAAVVALSLATAHPSAQGRPNFSGTWALASSAPTNEAAMGQRFTATQDATSLLVDVSETVQHVHLVSGGGSGGTTVTPEARQTRELYHLDGSEVRRAYPAISQPHPGTVIYGGIESSMSTASWDGQQLVIVSTIATKTVFVARGDVTHQTQTHRRTLRLEADGTLTVEDQYAPDPIPAGATGPAAPHTVKSTYRKVS